MRIVRVGLAGLGTVGLGTYRVLTENANLISARSGVKIEVAKAVVRNVKKAEEKTGGALEIASDFASILDDPTIDIAVELMGGIDAARTFVLEAIKRGKHVVTANKHLIATHGEEILRAAQTRGVAVAYEAAVAGGIPIIKALREGLVGDEIESVSGILNGTCNYIMTKMLGGSSYKETLSEAQKLGYAEADPTFDVEGIDTAHKITILSALAFGTPFTFEAAHIEGISSVTAKDVAAAQLVHAKVKLVAQAKKTDAGIEMSVAPRVVRDTSLFYKIDDVMNAVEVVAGGLGPTFYSGRGAGERPTASAVVSDIVDIARTLDADLSCRVPFAGVWPEAREAIEYVPYEKQKSSFVVRVSANEIEQTKATFARSGIEAALKAQDETLAVFFTKETTEEKINEVIATLRRESAASEENRPTKLHLFGES